MRLETPAHTDLQPPETATSPPGSRRDVDGRTLEEAQAADQARYRRRTTKLQAWVNRTAPSQRTKLLWLRFAIPMVLPAGTLLGFFAASVYCRVAGLPAPHRDPYIEWAMRPSRWFGLAILALLTGAYLIYHFVRAQAQREGLEIQEPEASAPHTHKADAHTQQKTAG